ncbi:MAG TPA: hypothetical protein VFA68_04525 [Terriglobales bacterium]|nr:hypothetical protein [Terriglobales bacterium]
MAEKTGIEQLVEKLVTEALESHIPQLRESIVRRLSGELERQLGSTDVSAKAGDSGGSADLLKAISAIHAGTTQREILRALLDNTVRYSGRAALFVVKAGAATGWQGRAFGNDDVKDFSLDVHSGVASRALQSRMAFRGKAEEMDGAFISRFGAPSDGQVLLVPLLLKDKVAALVYADAGVGGATLDAEALELLVAAAGAWLEVASLRKAAQKESVAEAATEREATPPVQTVSSFSDPFAGHAPSHAATQTAPAMESEPAPAAEAVPVEAVAASGAPAMSAEDADIHRKAQRFARLLVDEIKLYNQVKVTEGRKNKDLYDRLKEDIDKSRATYQKRYGNTVAGSADYFNGELVRSLAEDDSSIMGANFRR